jgi:hypothetical protein
LTRVRSAAPSVLRVLARIVGAAATLALGASLLWAAAPAALPDSALAVWRGRGWTVWWRSAHAPTVWAPLPALADGVRWRPGAPGVEWGELRLAGVGEAWRLRVIAVRVDPRRVRLSLRAAAVPGQRRGAWTVDSAGADAALALNAGQFAGATPWGWLVHAGREYRAPGAGALAPAVVVDTAGRVRLVPADSLAALRDAAARGEGGVREAFQSYPALLAGGEVPAPLHAPGRGVDVAHRDARLALGTLPDGRVLLALTRFDALGGALDAAPFGPTVPEMAAVMGALGARDAVLLDGGISGQLLVRDARGAARRWPGLRRVPLGLVGVAR